MRMILVALLMVCATGVQAQATDPIPNLPWPEPPHTYNECIATAKKMLDDNLNEERAKGNQFVALGRTLGMMVIREKCTEIFLDKK